MSQPVMIGRWLTPLISSFIFRMSHSSSSEHERRERHLVAQPHRGDRRLAQHRSRERRHRVGEVEHPRVGTALLHVARDVDHHRDVAQRPHDATGPDRVAHRLLDAVALGDGDVEAHALERARRDAHHHVVGTFDRFALVGRAGRVQADAPHLGDVLDQLEHPRDRRRIDVLDHDLGVDQRRHVDQVDEQLRGPLVRAATDERDLRKPEIRSTPPSPTDAIGQPYRSKLREPRGGGGEHLAGHGGDFFVGKAPGHRVGEHRLEHRRAIAGERGVDGELLRHRDPAQVLAQHRRHFDPVAGPHAVGVDRAHRLDDETVGQVRDLTAIRQVDGKVAPLAGDERVEQRGPPARPTGAARPRRSRAPPRSG